MKWTEKWHLYNSLKLSGFLQKYLFIAYQVFFHMCVGLWNQEFITLADILDSSDSCRTEGGPRIWTKLGQCGQ